LFSQRQRRICKENVLEVNMLYIKIGVINLLLIGFILELVGVGLFYKNFSDFFYTSPSKKTAKKNDQFQVLDSVFNPYFGYVIRHDHKSPGRYNGWITNNQGFQFRKGYKKSGTAQTERCCDYPYSAEKGEVLIGIFGGSVATGLAFTMQEKSIYSQFAKLNQFKGKKITILNFSLAGFRQPQSLQVLSYMASIGQKLDYVINIDGFNEAITSRLNLSVSSEWTYPDANIWSSMGKRLERLARAVNAGNSDFIAPTWYALMGRKMQRNSMECTFSSCYLWYYFRQYIYAKQEQQSIQLVSQRKEMAWSQFRVNLRPSKNSSIKVNIAGIPMLTAQLWGKSSELMAHISKKIGARYIHILQPNQWFDSNYKPSVKNHGFKHVPPIVSSTYPHLVEHGEKILKNHPNLTFKNFAKLLPGSDNSLFSDDCCHYTPKGNRIVINEIAKLF